MPEIQGGGLQGQPFMIASLGTQDPTIDKANIPERDTGAWARIVSEQHEPSTGGEGLGLRQVPK